MATYQEIVQATENFTQSIGVKVGKSKRYTRFLQPGIWDLAGKLMLRSKKTGRHIASFSFEDKKAIEAMTNGCELCKY